MIATPTPIQGRAAAAGVKPRRGWRCAAGVWAWRAGAALLLIWLVCWFLTDRFHWSQYIYWVSAEVAAAVGASLWLAGWALAGAGRAKRRRARRVLAALVVVVLGVMLVDWRAWRFAAPAPAGAGAPIRVLHWNPSDPRMKGFAEAVLAEKPDIAFITDPPWGVDWNAVRARIGGRKAVEEPAPGSGGGTGEGGSEEDDKRGWAMVRATPMGGGSEGGASALRFGYIAQLVIVSRYPIIRWGGTKLDVKDVNDRFFGIGPETKGPVYPGVAAFAELDTTKELGRPIVVWFIDMPSDVRLSRRAALADAARTMAGENAVCFVRDSHGQDLSEPGQKAFPPADLVVGDFNTPRGSMSLEAVARGMTDAYAEAGRGYCKSYPRWLPLTHLDHVFLAPWLRAESYRTVNAGVGRHRMQVCDLTRAPDAGPAAK